MDLQQTRMAQNGHHHATRSFMDAEPVHSVPGRVRIRAALLQRSRVISDRFRNLLLTWEGIHDVTMSGRCSTATIFYDCEKWSAVSLLAHIATLDENSLKEAEQSSFGGEESHRLTESWFNLCLSSSGLAVGLLVETVLTWPALFVSALPMLERARRALFEQQRVTLDVLDASAGGALIAQGFLPMAQFVVWLVNLSDYLRDRTGQASPADHVHRLPAARDTFSIVRHGESLQISIHEMQDGDLLPIASGESIPVEGTVRHGSALLDREMVTGQPVPQAVTIGDRVCATDRVCVGEIFIEAQRTEHDTGKGMQKPPSRRRGETRIEHYGRKWADSWVPLSFFASGAAVGAGAGLQGAAAPLIIDYGGVRIAAPTAVLSAMHRAEGLGILFKHGRAMERLARVDTMVFDKTNTLTTGIFQRAELHAYGYSMDELAHRAIEGDARRLLGYRDRIHAETASVLEDLRRRKIQRIVLLSGDSHTATKHAAETLGIEHYYGGMLPRDKAMVIHELKRQGHTVAMVGDGVNDAPAFLAADVGIAVAGSTPLASQYADIELRAGGLHLLCTALALSQEANDRIGQSWYIVSIPNTIALALTACAALGPLGAAILGNGSAIAATMNSLRPLLFRSPDIPQSACLST